jgi:hypothetical protein
MSNIDDARPVTIVNSAVHVRTRFWLTDPETRARICAATELLVAQVYWAVQDDVTFLEALESLAASTCDDLKLDRSFAPLIQARAAVFAAQWGTEYEDAVDPLSDDFLQHIAVFEKYPTTVQANLLDTYEDHGEWHEMPAPESAE